MYSVKASRFLTHLRRLREPEGPVDLLLERAITFNNTGSFGPPISIWAARMASPRRN